MYKIFITGILVLLFVQAYGQGTGCKQEKNRKELSEQIVRIIEEGKEPECYVTDGDGNRLPGYCSRRMDKLGICSTGRGIGGFVDACARRNA